MEEIEQICRAMAADSNIMTFSDIAKAAATGAAAGRKSQIPGGAVSGAALGVSVEATRRTMAMVTAELKKQSSNSVKKKLLKPS